MKINFREICAICGKKCDVKNHIKEIDCVNDNINTKNFIKNIISEVNI